MGQLTSKGLKAFLGRLFDIRRGEYSRAILMQLNIFLIISALLIVKPVVYSLFISKFGVEKLPQAFILVALAAGLVSALYSRVVSRVGLNRIFVNTLGLSVVTLVLFGILLNLNFMEGWVLYLFYVWVTIFGVLAASQFWILGNIIFNAREAKRLFGFIGAGAIAGGIFGGYLTAILAQVYNSEDLLFVAAVLLVPCIPITRRIWKRSVVSKHTAFQRTKRAGRFSDHPLNIILGSKHLSFLAAIVGVSVVVAKLVDYQFSAVASAHIEDPDDLTTFFGFWFSNLNLISLAFQLFLTSRVVGVFGVGTSLFFLPGGIMMAATGLLILPELWMAILLKVCDGSLKQSINRSAIELLALPIPLDVKNQTKIFIDVFVDSAATGLGGLIIIFMVSGLGLPLRFISIMVLILIGVWIYFAIKVRHEYLRTFKAKIEMDSDEESEPVVNLSQESVLGGLSKVLERGNEKQIVYVLKKIRELDHNPLFEKVRGLLKHPSPVVKAEALENLYFYKKPVIIEEVVPLLSDPDQRVKIEAFEYLIEHDPDQAEELFGRYLDDNDYRIRGAALLSLAIETRDNPMLIKVFDLERLVQSNLQSLDTLSDPEQARYWKINLSRVIGQSRLTQFYPTLRSFIRDEDPVVVEESLEATGLTLDSQFIPELIASLSHDKFKDSAVKGLLGFGHSIVDYLSKNFDVGSDAASLASIPAVLEKIDSQKSVDYLFRLLDNEHLPVRYEALRSLNTLKLKYPHLVFNKKEVIQRIFDEASLHLDMLTVLYNQTSPDSSHSVPSRAGNEGLREAREGLIDLLERRLDGNLERIFRLLGLKYPPDDMLKIYYGIQSKKQDLRTNAVEFLDTLLEPNLKRVLIPIVETALMETLSEEALRDLNLSVPDEEQCFIMLLEGKDVKVKLSVLYLISQLDDKRYLDLVDRYRDNENFKVRTYAARAHERLIHLG